MKRTLIIAAAGAVIGTLAGAAWPPPPIPRDQLQEPAWNLPSSEYVARFSANDYESATTIRWTGQASASAEAAEATDWGLAGILATPEPLILVTRTGQAAQHVRIGETLPDGSTLLMVEDDKITTRSGPCERVYQLHRRQAVDVSEGCTAADGSNTGNP